MIVDGHPSGNPVVRLPDVERGPILDRNGRVLAVTIERDSVTAWAPAVADPRASAALLADILDLRAEELLRLFGREGFVYVTRHVAPGQAAAIRAARDRGELRGIDLQAEQARSYPEGELAAHVLGFVGVDNVGLEGIENSFNHVLAPDTIAPEGTEVFGNQVVLTLDVNVQHAMEQLAADARGEHDADAVYIVVAAARTGEVLAYAAQPSFDPNAYTAVAKERWRNAIATMPYEPGSVFKIFTMASLLQSGAITPAMKFPSPGYYRRRLEGGGTIRIGDLGVYGHLDAENILRYSSNAGTAHASDRIDADTFHHLLRAFGFGESTGSPFPGESAGILRDTAEWSGRTKPTIAIGQEISVTALQVIQGASAFANGGVMLRPQLVREVVAADGTLVKPFAASPVREVVAPEVAARVLAMMETVATKGTGRLAQLKGYRIAAKTGTAQVFDRASGTYSNEHLIAVDPRHPPGRRSALHRLRGDPAPEGSAALRRTDRGAAAAQGGALPHHLLPHAAQRRRPAPSPRAHRRVRHSAPRDRRRDSRPDGIAAAPAAAAAGAARREGGAARLGLREPPGSGARSAAHHRLHRTRLAALTAAAGPAARYARRHPAAGSSCASSGHRLTLRQR